MKALAYDEKTAMVMVYTDSMLVRGEVVAKENVRVSIWLRTQGVPNYIHLHGAQVISFSGGSAKNYTQTEIFIPTVQVSAFHLAPPAHDPLDYDASEINRVMQPVNIMVGSFMLRGKMRISSQTEFGTSLDVMRASWASVYEVEVSNPFLPQFNMQVPMLLVNPSHVTFGLA